MQRALFFDGQDVQQGDADAIEDTTEAEVTRRIVDIAASTGICIGLAVSQTIPYTATVAIGTAYDSNGQWVSLNVPLNIAFSASDVDKYVVLQHATQEYLAVTHPITGAPNYTRLRDIVNGAVVSVPAPSDVIITKLSAIDGGGTATFDNTVRVFWGARTAPDTIPDSSLDQDGEVITHINARGTGVFSLNNPHALSPQDIGVVQDPTAFNHQVLDHVNNVEAGSVDASSAKVAVDSTTAPDRVTIAQLAPTDHILINGQRISSANTLLSALTFDDGTLNPALYEIMLDSTGLVTKYARATYNAGKTITGVQVVDVSPNHSTGSFNLVFNQAQQTLQWGSGPTQKLNAPSGAPGQLFVGDKFYKIRRGSNLESQYIIVWVDHSALPGITNTDAITVAANQIDSNHLSLATVPWSGSATGFLGYGDQSTSGVAYDKREWGNLDVANISEDFYELEFRSRMAETRADGFVTFGALSIAGLTVTYPYSVHYVRGKRFESVTAFVVTTDNATRYLYVNDEGTWVLDVEDPRTVQTDDPPRIAMGWQLVASGGVVTATDLRVDLRDPDTGPVKTNKANIFIKTQTVNGDTGDASAALATTSAPANFKLLWEVAEAGAVKLRLYSASVKQFVITQNARWNVSDTRWYPDDSGQTSSAIKFGQATILTYGKNTGSSNWLDGSWDVNALNINYLAQTFSWAANITAGSLTSSGAIVGTSANISGTATVGALSTAGTVAASTVTASTMSATGTISAATLAATGNSTAGGYMRATGRVDALNGNLFMDSVNSGSSVGIFCGVFAVAGGGRSSKGFWTLGLPVSVASAYYAIGCQVFAPMTGFSSSTYVAGSLWSGFGGSGSYDDGPRLPADGRAQSVGGEIIWRVTDTAGFNSQGYISLS